MSEKDKHGDPWFPASSTMTKDEKIALYSKFPQDVRAQFQVVDGEPEFVPSEGFKERMKKTRVTMDLFYKALTKELSNDREG